MMFSAPVFFDDGKNMFLAEGKTVKPYHLAAIKRWNIKYLLTSGHVLELEEGANISRMAGFDKKRFEKASPVEDADDVEELEEI
ncbi:MAG: phosphohydrolase [Treponema sp.]|nr:phosphohydrolase [Treponema sp.]